MSALLTCPQCNGPVAAEDFACGACGLLLVEEVAQGRAECRSSSSVEPRGSVEAALAAVVDGEVQARSPLEVEPPASSELRHALTSSPASRVGGEHPLQAVAEEVGLSEAQVRAVLHALARRGLVEPRMPAPLRASAPHDERPSAAPVPLARITPKKVRLVVRREDSPVTALAAEDVDPPAAQEG
ncbi:MAG: hypothetical protein L0Y66_14305 [Myxococcaceae bacterium]|nr:hypothetical protein [Myxococcaceae bacterium]